MLIFTNDGGQICIASPGQAITLPGNHIERLMSTSSVTIRNSAVTIGVLKTRLLNVVGSCDIVVDRTGVAGNLEIDTSDAHDCTTLKIAGEVLDIATRTDRYVPRMTRSPVRKTRENLNALDAAPDEVDL